MPKGPISVNLPLLPDVMVPLMSIWRFMARRPQRLIDSYLPRSWFFPRSVCRADLYWSNGRSSGRDRCPVGFPTVIIARSLQEIETPEFAHLRKTASRHNHCAPQPPTWRDGPALNSSQSRSLSSCAATIAGAASSSNKTAVLSSSFAGIALLDIAPGN